MDVGEEGVSFLFLFSLSFFSPTVISFEEPSRRSLCSSPVYPNHSHSDRNGFFLCPLHLFPRRSKVKYLGVDVEIEIGRILKRSVGNFFVLEIGLIYFDLGCFVPNSKVFSEQIDWTR